MKKLHLLLLSLTICLFSACHNELWEAIDGLDSRVTKLEELCKEMNTNITSLQTIVDVLQSNDFITGIVEIKKNGEVIGYTITFGKHDPITIYHGQDGKDGADGKDGQDGSANAPVIGVVQDDDGVYYWTLNGEWLLDDNGNKLPVSGKDGQNGTNGSNGQDGKDGITPQLKIEDGYWYISYDNGATWTQLGKATGEDGKDGQNGADGKDGQNGADGKDGQDGDSMFQSVNQDENYVYFTLADGTVIKIAKGNDNNQSNDDFIFTITYDPNGGEGVMPIDTFYYGMTKKLKNCEYTKKGHRFIGWNSNAYGTGASYTEAHQVTIDKNITLYAQWQEYEAIDLGLSVLWAAFDVGATSPDEIGHLFAWGEIEPKSTTSQFTWSTYKFGTSSQLTKYCTEGANGILDNKVTLDLEDDAANVHWGGDWRMPTAEEFTELIEKCKWSGYVYASGNGNSIHFPVYGHSYFGTMYYGYRAWSSSLSQNSNYAEDVYVHDRDVHMKLYSRERYLYGFIRPVKDKK